MTTLLDAAVKRRGGTNKILGDTGKPLLVIVSGDNIDAMVDAGLEAIGGLNRYIQGTHHVLLKPNTNQRDPFPSITDPATIRAVDLDSAGTLRCLVWRPHGEPAREMP